MPTSARALFFGRKCRLAREHYSSYASRSFPACSLYGPSPRHLATCAPGLTESNSSSRVLLTCPSLSMIRFPFISSWLPGPPPEFCPLLEFARIRCLRNQLHIQRRFMSKLLQIGTILHSRLVSNSYADRVALFNSVDKSSFTVG